MLTTALLRSADVVQSVISEIARAATLWYFHPVRAAPPSGDAAEPYGAADREEASPS